MSFYLGQRVRCTHGMHFSETASDQPDANDHITPERIGRGEICFLDEVATLVLDVEDEENVWVLQFDCYSRLEFDEYFFEPLSALEQLAYEGE